MSLSIFLPDLRGGGAERVCTTLSKEFNTRGYDVEFVLIKRRGKYLEDVPDEVSVVSLDAPEIPGYHALGAVPSLTRYLRRRKPDTLLSMLTRANLVAVMATGLSRVETRLILSERNHISARSEHTSDIRRKVSPKLIRLLYPRADGFIAVSEGVALDLATVGHLRLEEITTIYNPTVRDEVLEKKHEPVDHPWFAKDGPPVIIGVGSLTEQKDFPTLLKAFATLRDKRPCKLIILGKGNQRDRLESLTSDLGIENDVELAGFKSNPYAYIAAADVFVLSSAWEGLPNVLIEALACGTPVVSTDCPSGPREILQDGKYGPIVSVGNHVALAQSIETMIDNPTPEEHLLSRATDFRPEPIASQYLDVLFPKQVGNLSM